MAEWLGSPTLDQQVDLEGLGSNPGAGKLDSGFQLSVNEHQLHLEGGDEVDLTMASKINLYNFRFPVARVCYAKPC